MTGEIIVARLAAIALLALAAWRTWRVFRPGRPSGDNPFLFFFLTALCLLAMRWPEIKWPQELNPDESQMLVEGARLLQHPLPWRDVDGTTSGPLNYAVLSVPMFFGAPLSWQTGRIVLWAAHCLTLIFLYLALRAFGSRAECQFVLLPTIFFYAFIFEDVFTHYSSETVPALMLAACVCLLCREWSEPVPSLRRNFALGSVAGALPFAKLQALPLGFFVVAVALAQMIFKYQKLKTLRADWWRGCGTICLGGLLVPAVILGAVAAGGAAGDFWTSYILGAASYSARETAGDRLAALWFLLSYRESDFYRYDRVALVALLLLLVIWHGRVSRLGHRLFWPFLAVLADLVLTWFCLFVAGKPYFHYVYLLVPPLAMAFGLAFFGIRQLLRGQGQSESAPAWKWNPVFLAGCLLVMAIQSRQGWHYLKTIGVFEHDPDVTMISPVAKNILSISRPGDTMTVWGWMPSYYLETGLLPATRDTVCYYQIAQSPVQSYFRARFLDDFKRNPPEIFVDAIADGTFLWLWKPDVTHETFPELAQIIKTNYSHWLSIPYPGDVSNGVPVRIFVRNDRIGSCSHEATNDIFHLPAKTPPP